MKFALLDILDSSLVWLGFRRPAQIELRKILIHPAVATTNIYICRESDAFLWTALNLTPLSTGPSPVRCRYHLRGSVFTEGLVVLLVAHSHGSFRTPPLSYSSFFKHLLSCVCLFESYVKGPTRVCIADHSFTFPMRQHNSKNLHTSRNELRPHLFSNQTKRLCLDL